MNLRLVLVLFIASTACSGPAPGSISLSLKWAEPPDGQVWVWVRVEERPDPDVKGSILSSAGPASYVHGEPLSLGLGKVPNGKNRVVIVEVRAGENESLPVRYFGRSDPFALEPGKTVVVEVPLVLEQPEAQTQEVEIKLLFGGKHLEVVGPSKFAQAGLELRSQGAVSVLLANDESFSTNLTPHDLITGPDLECRQELEAGKAWGVCNIENWTLYDKEGVPPDGAYGVYARFVDEYGYESEVVKDTVVLDSLPPMVVNASVSPPVARAHQEVVLAVTFHEPLGETAGAPNTYLEVVPQGDAPTLEFAKPERQGSSNTYVWAAVTPEHGEDEAVYAFSLEAIDQVGNKLVTDDGLAGKDGEPISLTIDAGFPELAGVPNLALNQDLFGLAGGNLEFGFALIEKNPASLPPEDGSCQSAGCPRVYLGNTMIGEVARQTALDEQKENRWGFFYHYQVEPDDWDVIDKTFDIKVVWSDAAGNQAELTTGLEARLDFIRPQLADGASCSLLPELAAAASTIVYSLTASEPLGEAPGLEVTPDTSGLLSTPPIASPDGQGYSWQQSAATLSLGGFSVAASLTDLAGNESDGLVCEKSVVIDAEPPVLQNSMITTEPPVFNYLGESELAVGDGDTVVVNLTVSDHDGVAPGFPEVYVNVPGGPLGMTQVEKKEEGEWIACRFELTLDSADPDHLSAEGTWPIKVVVADPAGNVTYEETLDDKFVKLDFTPPVATSCFLAPELAGAAADLSYSVQTSELLAGPPQLTVSYGGEGLFSGEAQVSPGGVTYSWIQPVSGLPSGDYSVEAVLVDLVGNASVGPVCQLSGAIDSVKPEIETISVSTEPDVLNKKGDLVLAAGDSDIVTAQFVVRDDVGLSPDGPGVLLGIPGLPLDFVQLSSDELPDGGIFFEYGLELDQEATPWAEGYWPVRVEAGDEAGNVTVEDNLAPDLVHVDFTPPVADCLLVPESGELPYPIGENVRLQVTVFEELEQSFLPVLTETWSPEVDGPLLGYEEGTSYRFSRVVSDTDGERVVGIDVSLRDLVGNETEVGKSACSEGTVSFAIDGQRPEVLDVVLTPGDGQPLREGKQVGASITISNTKLQPTVMVGGGQMAATGDGPEGAADGPFAWEFQRELDGSEGEGLQKIAISGADEAGNSYSHVEQEQAVKFDFTAPDAECTSNLQLAKAGDTVRVTLAMSEPVENLALAVEPEGMTFVLNEGLSMTGADKPKYVYESQVKAGAPTSDWSLSVTATDLAGNPESGEALCSVAGVVDGLAIAISDWTVTAEFEDPYVQDSWIDSGLFARHGSRIAIELTLPEEPAANTLKVRVGDQEASFEKQEGLTYLYRYFVQVPDSSGQELKPVSVQLADGAGNETLESLVTLTFDYDPPKLAGAAYLERCDYHQDARIAQDDIWVKQEYDCAWSFDPDDCALPEGPVSGQIQVAFGLTEPVRPESWSIYVDQGPFAVDTCNSTQSYLVALYSPTGEETESECTPVFAAVTDRAGNEAELEVGCLRFDFTAPEPPDTDSEERILYTRIPWGSDATGGVKTWLVQGEPQAVEASAKVRVYDGEDIAKAAVVGQVYASDDGSFGGDLNTGAEFKLDPADRPEIYLTATDAAGNESDADPEQDGSQGVLVRHIKWIATMGYKVPGSMVENPHTFEQTGWARDLLEAADEASPDMEQVQSNDGLAATAVGAARWARLEAAGSHPTERTEAIMFFDSHRGRTVLLGGSISMFVEGYFSETAWWDVWEWEGRGWSEAAQPQTSWPTPRLGSACVHDEVTGDLVLFGGRGPATGLLGAVDFMSDTWEWDGNAWHEVALPEQDASVAPSARYDHAMVYDSARACSVLFGGAFGALGADEYFADVWEYSGTRWTSRQPADPEGDGNPSPRSCSAAVYDPVLQRTVIFGGTVGSGNYLRDTWAWNGTSWRLLQCSPQQFCAPEGRMSSRMVFDTARGSIWLFGGHTASGDENDLWELEGDCWYPRAADWLLPESGSLPQARSRHGMVYDPLNSELLVFGGHSIGSDEDEKLWAWDGTGWQVKEYSHASPGGRVKHAMACDADSARILLHGGMTQSGASGATWEWNGNRWQPVAEAAPLVGSRMVYDQVRKRAVLFGGWYKDADDPENMVLDLWGTQWKSSPPLSSPPHSRYDHTMVFDPVSGKSMIFGGRYDAWGGCFSDLWSQGWGWGGAVWQKLSGYAQGETPEGRSRAAMVYAGPEFGVLLHGGGFNEVNLDDLWRWKSGVWTRLEALDPEGDGNPTARAGHAMTCLSVDQSVLLWGGHTGQSMDDLWEWNGQSWLRIPVADPVGDGSPSARSDHELVHCPELGQTLLFGGAIEEVDTWLLERGAEAAPGQRVTWKLGATNHPVRVNPERLAIRWKAGGVGTDDEGQGIEGYACQRWSGNGWEDVALSSAGPSQPEYVEWFTTDGEILDRVLRARDSAASLRVVPLGTNGSGLARVSTYFLEAVFDYFIPLGSEQSCDSGEDEDLDGAAGCRDDDCDGIGFCEYGTEVSCGDGVDNDGDGAGDCDDRDCWCADECGLAEAGCCMYLEAVRCEDGTTVSDDCSGLAVAAVCGWDEQNGRYGCGFAGADPSGLVSPMCPGNCEPDCLGSQCGPDGCGSFCGSCPDENELCVDGLCQCIGNCCYAECGDDGCGGFCGNCEPSELCENGFCVLAGCQGLTWEGCCDGEILRFCANDQPYVNDCSAAPHCGWNPSTGFYGCNMVGDEDPAGEHPIACP